MSLGGDPFIGRAGLCLAVFFLLTVVSGWFSGGVYHQDDLQHFLYARWSRHDPRYLMDWWGRPGFTVLYALPAMIGLPPMGLAAGRLLSAVLAAATAWLAYRIARHFRLRQAWLAIPGLYLQPLFTKLALTTLTETPLAFYLALATWLLVRHRLAASAAIVALAPLTRHEAVILLPIWAVALWRLRASWATQALLLWALAAQNLLSLLWLGDLPVVHFLDPRLPGDYGHGTPLSFVWKQLAAAGPVITALAIMGSKRLWSRPMGWIVVVPPMVWWAAQTLLYLGGLYASGGYARFLVPIAPWVAVLAAAGAAPIWLALRRAAGTRAVRGAGALLIALWALCEIEWSRQPPVVLLEWQAAAVAGRTALAGLVLVLALALHYIGRGGWANRCRPAWWYVLTVVVLVLLVGGAWGLMPLQLKPQQHAIQQATVSLREPLSRSKQLLAVNAWVYYWTDCWRPLDGTVRSDLLDRAVPGTLFAWDSRFCPEPPMCLTYAQAAARPDWRLLWVGPADCDGGASSVAFFERRLKPGWSDTPGQGPQRRPTTVAGTRGQP